MEQEQGKDQVIFNQPDSTSNNYPKLIKNDPETNLDYRTRKRVEEAKVKARPGKTKGPSFLVFSPFLINCQVNTI